MGDFIGVQFGEQYNQRQANTLVDILEQKLANISTVFARAKRAAYQLFSSITPVGNVGVGEDTLITYTIPANTLAKDGYNFSVTAWGTFGATANNKTIKMYFGSSVLYDTGAIAANGGSWQIISTITRTGAATQQAITSIISSNILVVNSVSYVVPTETLSGTIIIKCTGTGTANNDIVQNGFLIKVVPQE